MSEPGDNQDDLAELRVRFLAALEQRRSGDVDGAAEVLRGILRAEPRLPEPHLELAHIHLEAGRLGEAELSAREGLKWLQQGGQWVEDLTAEQAMSLAHGVLAETLRQRSESDEAVFGEVQVFKDLIAESRRHFSKAAELDPENEHASHHAFFLNLGEE